MKTVIACFTAGTLSLSVAVAAPRDARPAAFSHTLPAEHTVELKRMPAVDVARLQARLHAETQFNRKVQINQQLREAQRRLAQLRAPGE